MVPELLKVLIADQREEEQPSPYVGRIAEKQLSEFAKNKAIVVITGVRRCGKSVLLF
jgi:predicted AAA+ superfamily ATPase